MPTNPYESPKSIDQQEADPQAIDVAKRFDSAYALAFTGLVVSAVLFILGTPLLNSWPIAQWLGFVSIWLGFCLMNVVTIGGIVLGILCWKFEHHLRPQVFLYLFFSLITLAGWYGLVFNA